MTKSYFKDSKEKYYNQQFQNIPRKIQTPYPTPQWETSRQKSKKKPNKQKQKQKE